MYYFARTEKENFQDPGNKLIKEIKSRNFRLSLARNSGAQRTV